MNCTHGQGRKTVFAGLLTLVLLCASLAAGSSAHADGPAAVFYGYVVPEPGGTLPIRVRAFSEHGYVCGSGQVIKLGAANAGFYVFPVVSAEVKGGCPSSGELIRLAVSYGLLDDDVFVGPPVMFRPSEATSVQLVRTSADTLSPAIP